MRDFKTDEPFNFVVDPDNHKYNQRRYEALGNVRLLLVKLVRWGVSYKPIFRWDISYMPIFRWDISYKPIFR